MEGIRANRNALNPLHKINSKAQLYKNFLKKTSLSPLNKKNQNLRFYEIF